VPPKSRITLLPLRSSSRRGLPCPIPTHSHQDGVGVRTICASRWAIPSISCSLPLNIARIALHVTQLSLASGLFQGTMVCYYSRSSGSYR